MTRRLLTARSIAKPGWPYTQSRIARQFVSGANTISAVSCVEYVHRLIVTGRARRARPGRSMLLFALIWERAVYGRCSRLAVLFERESALSILSLTGEYGLVILDPIVRTMSQQASFWSDPKEATLRKDLAREESTPEVMLQVVWSYDRL